VRDHDTADMATQAALTGHLVLSTLHTNDAPSSITRLLDLGVAPFLITSTVVGVMAQRLVELYALIVKWKAVVKRLRGRVNAAVDGDHARENFAPKGCLECRDTGYLGRVGLYEIMLMSNDLKRLLNDGAPLTELKKQAYREGLLPLRLAGAQKVAQGLTTIEEVLRVVPLN
jgi:general secretion pathway protein E